MAKNKTKKQQRKGFTIPIGVVGGFAAPAVRIWESRAGGATTMVRNGLMIMTGVDFWNGAFYPSQMAKGLLPVLGGIMLHKVVGGYMGVNRMLKNAGIPIIRI